MRARPQAARPRPLRSEQDRSAPAAPAPPLTTTSIGYRLRLTRAALGLSQAELCRLVGMRPNTYNQWETDRFEPRASDAARLVAAFGVTLDWIYLGNIAGVGHALAAKIQAIAASSPPPPTI